MDVVDLFVLAQQQVFLIMSCGNAGLHFPEGLKSIVKLRREYFFVGLVQCQLVLGVSQAPPAVPSRPGARRPAKTICTGKAHIPKGNSPEAAGRAAP